jgi:hypothetical protein
MSAHALVKPCAYVSLAKLEVGFEGIGAACIVQSNEGLAQMAGCIYKSVEERPTKTVLHPDTNGFVVFLGTPFVLLGGIVDRGLIGAVIGRWVIRHGKPGQRRL